MSLRRFTDGGLTLRRAVSGERQNYFGNLKVLPGIYGETWGCSRRHKVILSYNFGNFEIFLAQTAFKLSPPGLLVEYH